MKDYSIRIEIEDGEVEKILKEIIDAQEKIYEGYNKLIDLGVVKVKKANKANKELQSIFA